MCMCSIPKFMYKVRKGCMCIMCKPMGISP